MTSIKGILGEKLGMTQIFDETRAVPVTVIKAGPCFVAQVKTKETDGYDAVQLAFAEAAPNKPMQGHFDAHGGQARPPPGRAPDRRRVQLHAGPGAAGRHLRGRRARRRGRRLARQGVLRRHAAPRVLRAGLEPRHGEASTVRPGRSARAPRRRACSRACGWPASTGNQRITVLNLEVVQADPERNLLLIKGAVPGPNGGLVMVRSAVKAPAREGRLMASIELHDVQGKKVGSRDLPADVFESDGERAADAPGRDGGPRRASARARTRRRPAATSPVAGRSRGARRAPAAPARAPSARPSGSAAASRTVRTRTRTRCA